MAVSVAQFISSTNVTTNLTANYTAASTDKGLLVFVVQTIAVTNDITSVDVGATNIPAVSGSPITISTGDNGAVYAYFLGSGVPTSGAQTVTATVSGASTKRMAVYRLTGLTDIDLVTTNTAINAVQADPRQNIQGDGRSIFVALGAITGGGATTDYNPLTSWDGATNGFEQDQGANGSAVYSYRLIERFSVLAGWDQTSDEALAFVTAVADRSPLVQWADPQMFRDNESITIPGGYFPASQGSGTVKISPTDNVADGSAVTQTVTSWADTSITFTTSRGVLGSGPLYLFVTNNDGAYNTPGHPVMFVRHYVNPRRSRYPL